MSVKDQALKDQGVNPRTGEPYLRLKHGYKMDKDKSSSAAAGLARAAAAPAAAPAEAAARDKEITSLKEQVKKLEQQVVLLTENQQLAVKNAELAAKSTMEAQMHARYIQGLRDGAKLQSGQGLPSPGPPSSAH